MATLYFQEMMLLSKTEKKARRVSFSPSKNVILGENDVGKSTLLKALYHTLGADVPQLNNTRWKNANPIYCVKFSVSGISRYVVRDDKYFGLFDGNKQLISRHRGISGPEGIGSKINALLRFNIELEGQGGQLRTVTPAFYFLPFYIDQDSGWNTHWASFASLQAFKDYRKSMLDYHLGVRPQSYYDALSSLHVASGRLATISQEKNALISVRNRYRDQKVTEQVDLDPELFKAEIESLVTKYNALFDEQQMALQAIKDARNIKLGTEQEISVLRHAIAELEADYKFTEQPETSDLIDCPTCGTEFHNSIASRFGILDDIDYCRGLLDQKQKSLLDSTEQLRHLDEQYGKFEPRIVEISALLQLRRSEVTFKDIIRSEGQKDVLQTMSSEIMVADKEQTELERITEDLKKDMRPDADLKKRIVEYYRAKMKESLNSLHVHVLAESDYKVPDKPIKTNAMGSDLPRSLLAQHMSLLHTMSEFNKFTVCPLIIDSPLQQEQDRENSRAIFEFIFANSLSDEQVIIGTLEGGDVRSVVKSVGDVTTIDLAGKYSLLVSEEYESVLNEVSPLHDMTLQVPIGPSNESEPPPSEAL